MNAASPKPHSKAMFGNPLGTGFVGLLLMVLVYFAEEKGGTKHAILALVGLLAGIALYHASFGFTAAWRRFILERRSAGLRAQIIMLMVASLVFFPALAAGSLFDNPVNGYVFPVGVALVLGAFLFGLGMQIGGGCGSGTLFTIGGGSVRMVVTLIFFIIGSTIATATSDIWFQWPKLPAVSLIGSFGLWPALIGMFAGLGALYLVVAQAEFKRHGALPTIAAPRTQWISGPWALVTGAVMLALINIITLYVSGWPWGVTSAFALWGSKIAAFAGLSPEGWAFWQGQEGQLKASIFADFTSVMDFGIILGAMLAALLAGKFRPVFAIPLRSLLAACLGGLLLGIGARLGTGCNIGAFFSGTVSGSAHGWVWLIFAFAGNVLGVKARPYFRLD